MSQAFPLLAKENHDRLVREVAADYLRRGYSVMLEPQEADRPDFLQKFRPDILARNSRESVVVEVKSSLSSQKAQWKELAEIVQHQPGWRFELVLGQGNDELIANVAAPLYTYNEILSLIQSAREITAQGVLTAGFLTAWSALEATMRFISSSVPFDSKTMMYRGLTSRLYSEGWMDREDYDEILRLGQYRNQAAHGFKLEELQPEMTEQVCVYAERLLQEWQDELNKKEEAA